jgi:hypothetical protein
MGYWRGDHVTGWTVSKADVTHVGADKVLHEGRLLRPLLDLPG